MMPAASRGRGRRHTDGPFAAMRCALGRKWTTGTITKLPVNQIVVWFISTGAIRMFRWLKRILGIDAYRGTFLPLFPIVVSLAAGCLVLVLMKLPPAAYLWALAYLAI